MKLGFHVAIALALLPLQSVNAQGNKRDILGVSLGMPLPEVAGRAMVASAWRVDARAGAGCRGW